MLTDPAPTTCAPHLLGLLGRSPVAFVDTPLPHPHGASTPRWSI